MNGRLSNNLLEKPRALLTALHQAAVQGANPFERTHNAVQEWIAASRTTAGNRVHIFALGKAGATMAAGAVAALSEHNIPVAGGVVVVAAALSSDATAEQGGALPATLEVRVGDHPVPDIGSLAAADVIARKVTEVVEGDIVLVLISGGATSLCAAPCDELREALGHAVPAHELLMQLVATLHQHGLAIHEMNAIRRRLLRWGAGRLAVALYEQGAAAISVFAVSDVIGDDPSVIGSGPCSADPMSDAEFLAMLDAHNLRGQIPRQLAEALGLQGHPDDAIQPPAASHSAFAAVNFTIVARNRDACLALAEIARELGINDVTVVDEPMTGEAETLGHIIASIAMRAARESDGARLIVWGGEPTVSFDMDNRTRASLESDGPLSDTLGISRHGLPPRLFMSPVDKHHKQGPLGGRMQALALAASLALQQSASLAEYDETKRHPYRVYLLAAGTDGRDGPTDACGAIVDVYTPVRAREKGRDAIRDLHRLRSYYALKAARALLVTGPTGTNVMDVVAAYIVPRPPEASVIWYGGAPPIE
ncbi:MAG: DUF4147 domain-containing protein [Phycisphaerae bacterium]|nr:DUF4147 domain-containing protein [Gemmatimonadaceae bacterium]